MRLRAVQTYCTTWKTLADPSAGPDEGLHFARARHGGHEQEGCIPGNRGLMPKAVRLLPTAYQQYQTSRSWATYVSIDAFASPDGEDQGNCALGRATAKLPRQASNACGEPLGLKSRSQASPSPHQNLDTRSVTLYPKQCICIFRPASLLA